MRHRMRIRGCAAIFSLLGVLPLAGCTAAPPPFGASFDGETLTVITALCPTEKPVSLALRKPGTDLSDPPDFL